MKIALYQGVGFPSDISSNVNIIEENVSIAKKDNADVIVFPELFLTGYDIPIETLKELSRKIDQKKILSSLANKYGLAIVCGFSSLSEEKIENLCGFWDKKGDMLHQHKKVFLWVDEVKHFSPGNSFQIFQWNSKTIGICICFDIEFPESVRKLSMKGADVVFCVSAAMDCPNISDIMVPTRAMENHIFIIYCNRCGCEREIKYFGKSLVSSPDGNTLYKFSEEEIGLRIVDLDVFLIEQSKQVFSYVQLIKNRDKDIL